MTIHCCRCGRVLKASAVPIEEAGGAYGPQCARAIGLLNTNSTRRTAVKRKAKADERQLRFAL